MSEVQRDHEHGIRWARGGLIFGVLASVAGNVSNVCLTDSDVHVALRIPGAVIWPLALFVGIEVMVRNRQHRSKLAYLGRGLLMLVSVTTFLTSFVNLNGFMNKTDEPLLAQVTGPIGIDGLMLGCTVFLLAATLKVSEKTGRLTLQYARPIGPMPAHPSMITAAQREAALEEVFTLAELSNPSLPEAPVSPAPVSAPRERREQPASGAQEQALKMLLEHETVRDIVSATGVSRATTQRIAAALNSIRSDRQADVSAQKLRPELVSRIREAVTR